MVIAGDLRKGTKILYKGDPYTVNPMNEYIDYEALEELAHQHKPKIIIAGASSYSRIIDLERFHTIAKEVGAYLLVDIAHTAGLIATNLYPNPTPYADFVTGTTHKTLRGPRGGFILCKEQHQTVIDRAVFPGMQGGPSINAIAGKAIAFKAAAEKEFTQYIKKSVDLARIMVRAFEKLNYRIVSGGTDSHLFVIDLTKKELTGRAAEQLLEKAGILVSRSAIPFDPQKPMITSGIRLGTLAFTTRGFTEEIAQQVVELIDELLNNPENSAVLEKIAQQVVKITRKENHETS